MRLRLLELQYNDKKVKALRFVAASLLKDWKDNKRVLQYYSLPYISEIIRSKLISYHHNDLLTEHFGIDRIQELVAKKDYSTTFCRNVKGYLRVCNMYLASKGVYYKPYRDLQLLLILTHCWKDLSIDFMTDLLLSVN